MRKRILSLCLASLFVLQLGTVPAYANDRQDKDGVALEEVRSLEDVQNMEKVYSTLF